MKRTRTGRLGILPVPPEAGPAGATSDETLERMASFIHLHLNEKI